MPDAQTASQPQPELCNCLALRQASRHVTAHYDRALAPARLRLNQLSILARLDRVGATALGDLAALLVMDRSTLGHLLRPLQARGLVAIGMGGNDRRSRVIALTDAGRALLPGARRLWGEAQRRFEDAFGVAEALALRALLKQVTVTDLGTGDHP